MKVTVFTSTQPRHLSLIEGLSAVADEVFAVQECKTLFPGRIGGVFPESASMEGYFDRVNAAERNVFGGPRFQAPGIRQLVVQRGDLNLLDLEAMRPALDSDFFVVFGVSYIKGALIDFLVAKRAVNIHMGASPYYRGASCNFWALYDGRPDYVGATIHLLSKGLDSGPMLFHAFPEARAWDPFLLGMKSVEAAHKGVVEHLRRGDLLDLDPKVQDKSLQIRYSRGADFTDACVDGYLDSPPSKDTIKAAMDQRDGDLFLHPYIG